MNTRHFEIAVIGAGMAGIATAYYLATKHHKRSIVLIDREQPMSYTSAQSGDNYRNWWPHPVMTQLTDLSIDLMEDLARESNNAFNMTRRGYLLSTRDENIDDLIADLCRGYGTGSDQLIRVRDGLDGYQMATLDHWQNAPRGVDILTDRDSIRRAFPFLDSDIAHVVHIRRAGDISGQQLGQHMLQRIHAIGGVKLRAHASDVSGPSPFRIETKAAAGNSSITCDLLVNAAGPFADEIAHSLGVHLPVRNVFHQKIAFLDMRKAISRAQPFCIDLDPQILNWSQEELDLLADDPELAWLTRPMGGGVHCRPEGGDQSEWVKLGWAYNSTPTQPREDLANDPSKSDQFPEIVIRRASTLIPSLSVYLDSLPARRVHYGGYYTMTEENWPLIGPMGEAAFMVAALSGFGSMAACAAGYLCAAWINGSQLPDYAPDLSLSRYQNVNLLSELTSAPNKGVL